MSTIHPASALVAAAGKHLSDKMATALADLLLLAAHRAIVGRIVVEKDGFAGWRGLNAESLASATGTIEAILASKPFDIARFAVAQGTLSELAEG